jgi:hypothetical protein
MSSTHRFAGSLLILTLPYLLLSGCSLIGFLVGSAIDGGNDRYVPEQPYSLTLEHIGKGVTLQMDDGTQISGAYQGMQVPRTTPATYASEYELRRSRLSSPRWLPQPGDTLAVMGGSGGSGLSIVVSSLSFTALYGTVSGTGEPISYPLLANRVFTGTSGDTVSTHVLRRLLQQNLLPATDVLLLMAPEGNIVTVPVMEWVGLGIGLVTEIVLLVMINQAHEDAQACSKSHQSEGCTQGK